MFEHKMESAPSSSPIKLSVIIASHDRREYVINAVKSVLQQEYDRDSLEIIVVKNYEDQKIDEFLREQGVKNIISHEKYLGGKHAAGICVSSGDVISFLDDDDLFLPNKLKHASQLFKLYKFSFYHNDQSFTLSNSVQKKMDKKYKLNIIDLNSNDAREKLKKAINLTPHYNCSSISISRDIAIAALNCIKKITADFDTFWFLFSVDQGKTILVDNKVLTYYNRGSGGISRNTSKSRSLNYSIRALQSTRAFAEMFRNNYSNEIAKQLVRSWEIKYRIFDDNPHTNEIIKLTVESLRSFNKIYARKWLLVETLLSTVYIFNPSISYSLYTALYK